MARLKQAMVFRRPDDAQFVAVVPGEDLPEWALGMVDADDLAGDAEADELAASKAPRRAAANK